MNCISVKNSDSNSKSDKNQIKESISIKKINSNLNECIEESLMLPGIGHFIHEKLTISAKPKDDDYFNNEDSLMQEIHQEKTPLNILSNIVDNDTNKRNLKLSTTIDIKKTNKINNELSDGASKPNYSSEFPTIKRYLKRSSRFIQTLGSVLSKEKEEIKCPK